MRPKFRRSDASRRERPPTGHRIGEAHHKVRHSDAVVARARELRQRGMSYHGIAREIGVPWRTVADWCNYVTRYV
jgi:hypothetical protein